MFYRSQKNLFILALLVFQLGGKNAALIFEDADLENCVQTTLRFEVAFLLSLFHFIPQSQSHRDSFRSCFANQGEVCLCTSRVYVHQNIYEEFVKKLVAGARCGFYTVETLVPKTIHYIRLPKHLYLLEKSRLAIQAIRKRKWALL